MGDVQDVARVGGRRLLLVMLDGVRLDKAQGDGVSAGEHHRAHMGAADAVGAVGGAPPLLIIVRATLHALATGGDGGHEAEAATGANSKAMMQRQIRSTEASIAPCCRARPGIAAFQPDLDALAVAFLPALSWCCRAGSP